MAIATGTLIGLEVYLNNNNQSVFDELELPSSVDKETLIDTIMLDVGDYEPLWYDPFFFKNMVGIWSRKWYRTFEKWGDALAISYEPLENYDRREEWEDISSDSSKMTGVITGNTKTDDNSNSNSNSSSNINSNSKNNVSAYNSNDYSPSEENISSSGQTDENNITSSSTISSANNSTSKSTTENTSNNKKIGREHGNIGVTTSQQMLQSELDVASWNLYQHITDIFAKEFLLMC